LPAGHVQDSRGVVDDLVEREQAKVDRHDLDDWAHPVHRGADSSAHERGFGEWGVADAFGAEFVEQALGHREGAAVTADIFAHHEHARVADEGIADRLPHGLAVGGANRPGLGVGHGCFRSE
jgi:hypothetical protein